MTYLSIRWSVLVNPRISIMRGLWGSCKPRYRSPARPHGPSCSANDGNLAWPVNLHPAQHISFRWVGGPVVTARPPAYPVATLGYSPRPAQLQLQAMNRIITSMTGDIDMSIMAVVHTSTSPHRPGKPHRNVVGRQYMSTPTATLRARNATGRTGLRQWPLVGRTSVRTRLGRHHAEPGGPAAASSMIRRTVRCHDKRWQSAGARSGSSRSTRGFQVAIAVSATVRGIGVTLPAGAG